MPEHNTDITNLAQLNPQRTPFEQLINFLQLKQCNYALMSHTAEGRSEAVANVRGTEVGQGAKALVCKVKAEHTPQYVLAVVPGDRQLDFKKLALYLGVKKMTLAHPDEAFALTGCVLGTIPPFSFHPDLQLFADPSLFERFDDIAFNACSLETSIKLSSKDYLAATKVPLFDIIKG